jgi:ABC-type maltose transport system permease subunit
MALLAAGAGLLLWSAVKAYGQKEEAFLGTVISFMALLVMLPVIAVFLINQRFFVEGIKMSGFRGA